MKKLHNTTVKKYTLATLLLGAGMHSFAQETPKKVDPATPVTIDSFDVVRDYKPILADAVKIRRSPDMTNKREYQPKLTYTNITDKKLDINTGLRELNVKELPFSQLADQTSNYVKFGVGNYNTILGEAYLAVDRYENTRFGLFAKHLNQKGSLEGQKFATQDIGIFGRRVYDPVTVNGTLGYNRYSTNFYGQVFDGNANLLNPSPEAQAFNDIYFNGELTSNTDVNQEGAVSYSAKADAYLFKDKYNAKENSFALSGHVNKKVNTFNVGANLSASFNSVDDVNPTKNHVASVNPYIRFKGDHYNVTLGANLVSEFGDTSRFNVFPTVEADFAVVPQYVYLFAGANGGVKQGSLRTFAKENPYLNSNIDVRNTLEKLHVYAGLKGNAGANFGYKVKAFYKQLEGLALFVNSDEVASNGGFVPYKFDVMYDGYSSKATHFGLEGEINIRLSQLVNLGGKLNIDDYKVKDTEEAWSLPKFRFLANARFNISDKFFVDAELSTQGETSALAYTYNSQTDRSPTRSKVTIPSFADFNAGAEYRIKKQLGIFVKANNIFGTEYERYLYYPRLGFNVIGGINFSF
ncbi:hypothetical protein KO02_19465 [Sphingobacterium sp. ML3W]|uniref:TonB-dependent receptor n=1 Tax=Sphingobacterium TaxID=28453 RepID=UPI0004F6CC07|nr:MULTISPECIES: TonB-dependent receptor [Sphingobacterium]AIM38630.1 hypothetical protein KO02_19465 [Sphingobacterium sp. ML3W]MDH5825385.1 TonB-dependent receptor [Sphingobacterium faecium]